jgi:hypothetical protein
MRGRHAGEAAELVRVDLVEVHLEVPHHGGWVTSPDHALGDGREIEPIWRADGTRRGSSHIGLFEDREPAIFESTDQRRVLRPPKSGPGL